MKELLAFAMLVICIFTSVTAQPTHQIKGVVIDKSTRQPLEFINVLIIGTDRGSVTDSVGHFIIDDIPPGIYRLQASAIGYKTTITSEYILSTKNLNVDIEMEEKGFARSGLNPFVFPAEEV